MKTKDIIGGVSPLKQRQPSRGGKYAGAATRTAKQRGGYAKSTGVRGAGGRNVGGYNVNTRFRSRGEWQKPVSGGTAYIPTAGQKILEDPKGTKGTQYRTLEGEKAKKGNEFADNCYDADGKVKKGHTYYSDIKGYSIACTLGGTSDGSFDYSKGATDAEDQSRTYETTPEGVTTYGEWEKLAKKK